MYTCKKALLLPNAQGSRYIEAIVADTSVRELMSQYTSVYLMIDHPALDEPKALLLEDVSSMIYNLPPLTTVSEWLASIGNTTLPLRDKWPVPYGAIVRFNDAFAAGYQLRLMKPGISLDTELPASDMPDILMTKDNVDYQDCFDYLIPTVNGLLHMTDASPDGFIIKDGGRSVVHSNKNKIGLLSFSKVGKIKLIPITPEMITPRGLTSLHQGFRIKLPEKIGNRVVMMSIGGVLHFHSHNYRVIGDDLLAVDWWKIPFVRRYYDTRHLIDLSAYDSLLDRPVNHGDALDLEKVIDDELIVKYMTLSQTFVILLEADTFYVNRIPLEHSALPGMYYCYEEATLPIQLENGLIPSYVYQENGGKKAVVVEDNIVRRYRFDSSPDGDGIYRLGMKAQHEPAHYANAFFLELGAESI